METIKPLKAKLLYKCCDPNLFDFETTSELEDLNEFIGQTRALDAVKFGVDIKRDGYNVYVLGPSGIGKHSVIRKILEQEAKRRPAPFDWCYVYNFDEPQKPIALKLPAEYGTALKIDMEQLIEEFSNSIPALFESSEYRSRIQMLSDGFNEKQRNLFKELEEEAKKNDMLILSASHGFTVVSTKDGQVMSTDEFDKLPKDEREHKESILTKLSQQLEEFIKKIPLLQKERRKLEKKVQKQFIMSGIDFPMDQLKKKYGDFPQILNHLNAVQHDLIEHVKDFLPQEESRIMIGNLPANKKLSFTRYKVNVLVTHDKQASAPVIYEDNPSYTNLIGRIEYLAQLGTWVTDFTLIKPGALHRANGGYLIVDVFKLLAQPLAWDSLKRVMYAHKVIIEPLAQTQGFINGVSLEPMPISVDLKIILLGDPLFYYFLCEIDPDFNELFKVAADFEESIGRNVGNTKLYAQLIATLARKEGLKPFHRSAVARIIEHAARLVEDSEKLSVHMRSIADLMRESDYWAGIAGQETVEATNVQQAIHAHTKRVDRMRDELYQEIDRNFILIETKGAKIGQVNALSVLQLGDFMFGHPMRVTATVRSGKGEVINIERESELSGNLHSKGIFILSGFISGRYAQHLPLSLFASLVFEQMYTMIEGDSASAAELCALLSALADVPAQQGLAVTGSINQHGQVQAIGGVNEKIEGFFDVCKLQGLTGKQGVIIPLANVKNLMLRTDVVESAAAKRFHIYAVETIDEAMSLLTGVPAGERKKTGKYSLGSINQKVELRLYHFVRNIQKRVR